MAHAKVGAIKQTHDAIDLEPGITREHVVRAVTGQGDLVALFMGPLGEKQQCGAGRVRNWALGGFDELRISIDDLTRAAGDDDWLGAAGAGGAEGPVGFIKMWVVDANGKCWHASAADFSGQGNYGAAIYSAADVGRRLCVTGEPSLDRCFEAFLKFVHVACAVEIATFLAAIGKVQVPIAANRGSGCTALPHLGEQIVPR